MATEVFIPKMTDFMEEGTIVAWLVAEGDAVTEGQAILEIETDKATAEMEAPASGWIKGISPRAGAGKAVPWAIPSYSPSHPSTRRSPPHDRLLCAPRRRDANPSLGQQPDGAGGRPRTR